MAVLLIQGAKSASAAPRWLRLPPPIPLPQAANRLLHAAVALGMGGLLGICAWVQPDASGKATHQRLGLPKCLICQVTSWERCPSCGLTTAFCHVMRGQLSQARKCHAAVLPVFGLWLALAAYCALIAALGKQWLVQEIIVGAGLAWVLLGCWIAALLRGT